MKKKTLLACLFPAIVLTCVVSFVSIKNSKFGETDSFYVHSMELNSTKNVVNAENGILHQISVKSNTFDLVGWDSTGGRFGSIQSKLHGPSKYSYRGMIYNRSYINGFKNLKVTFSGGDLYVSFTDFLMEDMTFTGKKLQSGVTAIVPEGKAYFIVYTDSQYPVYIDSFRMDYVCAGDIDQQLIYNSSDAANMGGARSISKKTTIYSNYVELENNPTKKTNNYSVGKTISKDHNDSWYRWNGRFLRQSRNLGSTFSFGLTIAGSYSMMTDESKNFNYSVWPELTYVGASETSYVQTYIGNDNYEPLGTEHRLHPDDDLADPSYTGRFFTDYDWDGSKWCFVDPDTTEIAQGGLTFREAYETYNLPFWFIRFDVRLQNDDPVCDVTINGFHLYTYELFENYDKVNKPSIYIKTLPMHLVNYGVDAEGTPDASYTGAFTYPRIIA